WYLSGDEKVTKATLYGLIVALLFVFSGNQLKNAISTANSKSVRKETNAHLKVVDLLITLDEGCPECGVVPSIRLTSASNTYPVLGLVT
ncbi:hypothetical protein OFN62_32720, partial [Escherichia coli]|nr:hypothetical protein [Escherichia coli]